MKQIFYVLVSAGLVLLLTFLILNQRKRTNLTFPDFGASLPAHHQILGIDISHHQGIIDWGMVSKMKIRQDSVQFVYLKLTEGTDFSDIRSVENQEALNQLNIPFGVYHFYNPNKSAYLQANYFVENCKKNNLKPVLDIELQGALTPKELVDSTIVFLNIVENKLNIRPIIYTYESFYTDFFVNTQLVKEWFWIANYNPHSAIFGQSNVIAWQFTDKGTIDGIQEKVDLNTAKPTFWKVAIWE